MGFVMGLIALAIIYGMLTGAKEHPLGKVLLFAIFMIIICSIFGSIIPFSALISKIAAFIMVAVIIYFGYTFIFG